jgi:anaerobic magnesium-protoporphyrin IX monomethyl ester cyclase
MVLLFNPRATNYNPRIPNSVLQIAASIHGVYDWTIVDGNLEQDPWPKIEAYLKTGHYKYFGCTVMPGPQLRQAIPYCQTIKQQYPAITIVWGGYFASNQYKVCLESGYIDYLINGPGDQAFPELLNALQVQNTDVSTIKNLIYKQDDKIVKTAKAELFPMDDLPPLPYDAYHALYPLQSVLPKTYLGKKTLGYHSSFGCPFTCSFCAVVPIYNARWNTLKKRMLVML